MSDDETKSERGLTYNDLGRDMVDITFNKDALRRVIANTFEAIGGQGALNEWARENPRDFYLKMFTKIMSDNTPKVNKKESIETILADIPLVNPEESDKNE